MDSIYLSKCYLCLRKVTTRNSSLGRQYQIGPEHDKKCEYYKEHIPDCSCGKCNK